MPSMNSLIQKLDTYVIPLKKKIRQGLLAFSHVSPSWGKTQNLGNEIKLLNFGKSGKMYHRNLYTHFLMKSYCKCFSWNYQV